MKKAGLGDAVGFILPIHYRDVKIELHEISLQMQEMFSERCV